ncbi:tRNA uridine-5-carboxymethylaminomethyl(34) synthesis GTPase MnmE [Thermosulfurimonas sp. F29]|uniref:tRNA uridine-5-carboxymethylaminomethyl(34) synthesis GTPase MnmE n=1 Tax=Thermosulfurimonas sp. F29 TaxID=2867247 RepID=UPI001C82FD41|nr:tRNA uridine-5-carboxymethylaminomethyl(34) synthesis GTPase MnmE [Thermosulfurimonas sp. F29]MBX6422309.1 tRNA uridine-5-carboxymethylaminomethyl(34) synthesis GTPase MnmE [Thermosulfurimonas sp. F29]
MTPALSRTEDTIAAIATPPGPGAIGVIKVSGPESEAILRRIFRPARPREHFESHRLYYGHIVDPETGETVDEVLVALMRAPRSYTREDVLEIYAHSGYRVLTRILELVLASGARPAEPGEFTRRAFLNGRLDLAQAEAVQEIITARSDSALRLALGQLSGKLSERVHRVREVLLDLLAVVEAAVDFPEEDLEILAPPEMRRRLAEEVLKPLHGLIRASREGRIFREGIAVVLAGRPNVGKSSLLNALLREERAIVTPVPGTTRDVIEETAQIAGLPVRLIDTAGLRETTDRVEALGVARAREKLRAADVVVFLVDGSRPPEEADRRLYEEVRDRPHVPAVNKIDIASGETLESWRSFFPEEPVFLSALEGTGLSELSRRIFRVVTGQAALEPPEIAPNLRQKAALERAAQAVERALALLEKHEPLPELLSVEIREALSALSEITGEVTTEDLLDKIFTQFCIGK